MKLKSTWDYILSQNHILPSPLANKLGVPVLRTILANMIINLRRYKNYRAQSVDERSLIKNGIIVIENFLPCEEFNQLKQEFYLALSKYENKKTVKKGSMHVDIRQIKGDDFNEFPTIKKFAKNEKLIKLIAAAEGVKVVDQFSKLDLETTKFGDPSKDEDLNVPFHADVHFHSHKILFYINDVKLDGGPFIYCKNSHKNKFDRLLFELMRGQLKDSHEEKWRIQKHLDKNFFKKYFQKLKKQEYKVACPANTLVIANVHGFHKRGESNSGVERSLIRIPFRYNPLGPVGHLPRDLYSGSFF